jgi:hypothetical protein
MHKNTSDHFPTKMGMIDSIADGGKEEDPEGIIQAISRNKAEGLLEIIRSGMTGNNKNPVSSQIQMQRLPSVSTDTDQATLLDNHHPISIADELRKLADLRSEGILTEEEFEHIKQEIIRKISK